MCDRCLFHGTFWGRAILPADHSIFKEIGYFKMVQKKFFLSLLFLLSFKKGGFQQLITLAMASASANPQISNPVTMAITSAAHALLTYISAEIHTWVLLAFVSLSLLMLVPFLPIEWNYIYLSWWVCLFIPQIFIGCLVNARKHHGHWGYSDEQIGMFTSMPLGVTLGSLWMGFPSRWEPAQKDE